MAPMKMVHIRRWQLVGAFVLMALINIGVAVILTHYVHQINHDKASIRQLESSNCKTRDYLISSAKFRARRIPLDKTVRLKRQDRQAANVAIRLANSFANELCPDNIPQLKQLEGAK